MPSRSLFILIGVLSIGACSGPAGPHAPAPAPGGGDLAPPLVDPVAAAPPDATPPDAAPLRAVPDAAAQYHTNFADTSVGALPAEWLNVASIGAPAPWVIAGDWSVVAGVDGQHLLRQRGLHWPTYRNAPPLSFMRFDAGSFGQPDHRLPARYHTGVTLRVAGCDPQDPYYPIGDTGVQVYFVDPTHYCEVIFRPSAMEVWQCYGGVPFHKENWTQLAAFQTTVHQHQPLVVEATVDTHARTLTVLPPGSALPVVLHAPLLADGPHWLTLRASNSIVDYERVDIQALP